MTLKASIHAGSIGFTGTTKYQSWAKCLFDEGSHLRHPVFFWATTWKSDETGVWDEYGSTSLAFLEYLLIGVAGGMSDSLLNREGVSRTKDIL